MGDKLIVMVGIADEETAKRFTSTDRSFKLMDEFDMTMMSRWIELSDYDTLGAKGIDLDNMIKNVMRNHVHKRRNRNEMDEKYGKS